MRRSSVGRVRWLILLHGAIINGSLTNAVFNNAQLVNVVFNGADLTNAKFDSAYLQGTDFSSAVSIAGLTLSNAAVSTMPGGDVHGTRRHAVHLSVRRH